MTYTMNKRILKNIIHQKAEVLTTDKQNNYQLLETINKLLIEIDKLIDETQIVEWLTMNKTIRLTMNKEQLSYNYNILNNYFNNYLIDNKNRMTNEELNLLDKLMKKLEIAKIRSEWYEDNKRYQQG